ncbi:hypothetical protein [Verrucomicrobium sp. BvORR034]|uniref:hypothetical protein n=1 Tax=Verrucomicrobium sp. BvORR034 TaxID=1396418 RepID=UPI000679E12E|nr:hypothetical protein [Verrucomicrobium sp. BvORR034]
MNTHYIADEVAALLDRTAMVRGTLIEGPRLVIGQRGESRHYHKPFVTEVVGIGIVDPSLDSNGRQGVLLRVIEGDVEALGGVTLCFAASDSLPAK